jgi:hypothetical protein
LAIVISINRACALRGDAEANRRALIAECTQLPPNKQTDLVEHFDQEARIWARAAGRQE